MNYVVTIFIPFFTCFSGFISASNVCKKNIQVEYNFAGCIYRCNITNDIYCKDDQPLECGQSPGFQCPSETYTCKVQQCTLIAQKSTCSDKRDSTLEIPYCNAAGIKKDNESFEESETPTEAPTTTEAPRTTTESPPPPPKKPDIRPDAYDGRSYAEAYQPYIFSMVLALIPLVMYLVYRLGRYAMMLQIEASEAVEPPNFNPRRPPSRMNSLPRSPNRSPLRSPHRSPQRSSSSRISTSSENRSPQANSLSPHRLSPRAHTPHRSSTGGYPIGLENNSVLLVVPSRRHSTEPPPDLPPPYSSVEPNVESPPTYIQAMQNIEKSKPTVEV